MGIYSDTTWCNICNIRQMRNTGKVPKLKLLFEAIKSLKKLKSRISSITFLRLGKPSDLNIVCYADATYVSLEDESTRGGFIIFVSGTTSRMASICWSSKKLDWVTKSPSASETLVLSKATDAGVLIAAMLQETFRLPWLPEVL